MPFTAAQTDAVMGYLGYAVTAENTNYVQGILTTVENQSADAVTRVQDILTKLSGIDSDIDTARNTAGGVYTQLLSEGQRNVGLLAFTLGIEAKRNIY
ncbi:MAG TPA: hypothetical protein V6C63_02040 [Allocoleopsis sp.]